MHSFIPVLLTWTLLAAQQPAAELSPEDRALQDAQARGRQDLAPAPMTPELEARVQRLGKQLRCAVCQGVSIADSPAQMARAQLDKVRTLIAEGRSDEEIKAYFVERYGEWALLSPPAHGTNWIVWLAPVALLLFGAVLVWRLSRPVAPQAATEQSSAAPPSRSGSDSTDDPYLRAVRGELEK